MAGRILTIDIETKPALAYVWGLFDQNIGLNQLVEPSAPICFAAKFVGEKEIFFHADWTDGHEGMVEAAHSLISEADAVVGYNSDGFDLRKLRGEFVLAELPPAPPVASIDLLKTVKKFGFQSNKLAYIGPFLDIGSKVKNEGFELWAKVIEGDIVARKKMERYCIGDVKLTERLYTFIKPYIDNHPHVHEVSEGCPACGSPKAHSRGWIYSPYYKTKRLQCTNCFKWRKGKREKI